MQPELPRDAVLTDNIAGSVQSGLSGAIFMLPASGRTLQGLYKKTKTVFFHVSIQTDIQTISTECLTPEKLPSKKKYPAKQRRIIPSKQLFNKALIFLILSLVSVLLLPASGENLADC